MPATRLSSRTRSKGKEPASLSQASIPNDDDDVIIISSDEEDPDSTSYALRKAQQEIRSLKRKLAKEASGSQQQVLSDQRNHHVNSNDQSSSHLVKSDEERLRLEAHLQQATTDISKLQAALRNEKESRVRETKRLKKRADAAALEIASLKVVNQELRSNSDGSSNNKALHELENHILCEVCTERLWHPYTLTGCGHTFCQGCLTDWLNATIIANAFQPQYTCPTCRAPVLHKPIEDYTFKGVVRAIAQAIDPAGRSPPPPPRGQGGRGPWFRFFG